MKGAVRFCSEADDGLDGRGSHVKTVFCIRSPTDFYVTRFLARRFAVMSLADKKTFFFLSMFRLKVRCLRSESKTPILSILGAFSSICICEVYFYVGDRDFLNERLVCRILFEGRIASISREVLSVLKDGITSVIATASKGTDAIDGKDDGYEASAVDGARDKR